MHAGGGGADSSVAGRGGGADSSVVCMVLIR